VAVLVAIFNACLNPAAGAAMRLIVSDAEMPVAVSVDQMRNAALTLAGPALGGLLFEVSPALPFAADAVSYAISLFGIVAISTPLTAGRDHRSGDRKGSKGRSTLAGMFDGVKFIYQHSFMRYTMANSAVANFAYSGTLLSVIISAVRNGSTSLTTGAVIALVGGGTLAGSLIAPALAQRLTISRVSRSGPAVAFACFGGSMLILAALNTIGRAALNPPTVSAAVSVQAA
jgi:MFS family permease